MITTTWDKDHEFLGFDGLALDIPLDAIGVNGITAAIVTNGLNKLREPVWLFPRAARDLEDAKLIDRFPEADLISFGSLMVRLYSGPL